MAMMDCGTAMGIVAIGALCCTAMITIVLHYMLKRFTAEDLNLDSFDENNIMFHFNFPNWTMTKNAIEIELSKLKLEDKLIYFCGSYGRVYNFLL